MSNFTGMDIGGVRTLAGQMDQKAEEIRSLMGQLTTALQSAQWVGPDREQFLNSWQTQHVQQLNNVVQGLTDAANRARQNAQQQEAASTT